MAHRFSTLKRQGIEYLNTLDTSVDVRQQVTTAVEKPDSCRFFSALHSHGGSTLCNIFAVCASSTLLLRHSLSLSLWKERWE